MLLGCGSALRRVPQPAYENMTEFRGSGVEVEEVVAALPSQVRFVGACLGQVAAAKVLRCSIHVERLAIESDAVGFRALDEAATTARGLLVSAEDPPASTLCELSLRRNEIDAAGARALARLVLRVAPGLERLYVGGNPIGDEGAQALSDIVARCQHLEVIDLSDCELSDDACFVLARALRKRTAHVDISRNPRITDRGIAALARVSETLDAAGCDARSVESLLPALRRSKGLRDLALADTGLDPRSAADLVDLLLSKTSRIRRLDLSSNPLTPRAAARKTARIILDSILPGADADPAPDDVCALCAIAAALRSALAAPDLELLRLNDVGARPPHEKLLKGALAKHPRLHIDLRANPLLRVHDKFNIM
ncbi:hypothetical protein CTAYLR_006914 [Chrysophaeum taylorii]|uniref:Uncharacterized protein n=1 Tax=Chrysophaeum taylorii TaxID=2483200 RepID=A0AAD7XJH2_9STRA|nr:hypothetical protein CTAYLR_006914 [Chrysophaeum taylorii]